MTHKPHKQPDREQIQRDLAEQDVVDSAAHKTHSTRFWTDDGFEVVLADDYDALVEQFEALRDAAERVVAADNQSLGAMGAEGDRAQAEMMGALHALRVLVDSSPASEPEAS